jgi:hypothetical protein
MWGLKGARSATQKGTKAGDRGVLETFALAENAGEVRRAAWLAACQV